MIDITRQFYAYFGEPEGWVRKVCCFAVDEEKTLHLKDESDHFRPIHWSVLDMGYEEITELLIGPKPSLEFQIRGVRESDVVVRSDFERVQIQTRHWTPKSY
jgi:hypothetical protein